MNKSDLTKIELSDELDISNIGLTFWNTHPFDPIQGCYCTLEYMSDAYLDAINDNTIINYIKFFI